MLARVALVLAVTILPACGAAAPRAARPTAPPRAVGFHTTTAELHTAVERHDTTDDYVVGPFEEGESGVRTYYIVRN